VNRKKEFSDGVTYEAIKILKDNITGGTGGRAQIGCPAGGKTGTTDKNIDAWFVGFTPRLSTAVWVGFPGDARRSMNGLFFGANIDGGTFPAQIWGDYMKKAKGSYCGDFKQPTEPFQSQPFFGHYSRSGKDETKSDDPSSESSLPTTPPAQEPEAEPERDNGNGNGNGGNGNDDAAFDPNQYETPPQGAPTTESPGGGTQAPGDG
jgi:penicillin-binding protein 1A